MDYYDARINRVRTEAELRLLGVPLTGNAALAPGLDALGLYPMTYAVPAYNATFYAVEPDGAPAPATTDDGGQSSVQSFTVVPRPLDQAQAAAKTRVTTLRWAAETGGITLASGLRVLTGIDDRARVVETLQGMRDTGLAEIDFKAASGWVRLTLEELTALAGQITTHVQACFSRERSLHEAVDACESLEALLALDISNGWPDVEVKEGEESAGEA